MERISVKSTNIKSIGYNLDERILEVEFMSGEIYQYFGIHKYLYDELMRASLKGSFLNDKIKYSYRYQKVR